MEKNKYIQPVKNLLYIIAFLWIMHLASYFIPVNNFGIIPRDVSGLPGIVLTPFLHRDFSHLAANSVSLFVLGLFLITLEDKRTFRIMAAVAVMGGAGTWLIGRGAIHIGASGVIYGILGYLITRGFFKRDLKSIVISVIVLVLYCGMIFGVFPGEASISWESHLSGFVSGVILASFIGRK